MRLSMVVAAAVTVAWFSLWATSNGILVYSSDTGVLKTRDCRYLVGVTVQKRLEPLAQRCPVVRSVGR
jgi:hypothetical protein